MAKPSSSPTDLANLLESLTISDNGSAAEQALSNILGLEVSLDAGVEGAADFFAKELGLRSKNSLIQIGVFVLTKAAILETAQLVGIGGGFVKLDLMSFHIAQLMKLVEEINVKLDVILSTPLKLALDFFGKALRHMENENIPGIVKEIEKVKDHAMQAFRYAEGQGPKTENLKNAVLAKQLVVLAEILIQSYNNTTIVPFSLLEREMKQTISSLIKDEVSSMQRFHDSQSTSMFTWNKAEKAKKKQDIMDSLLRTSYPFISEGDGLTSTQAPLQFPFNLTLLPIFLPEGEEDSASLTIGQHKGRPLTVRVWKEEGQAFCKSAIIWQWQEMQSANIGGPQVTFQLFPLSAPQTQFQVGPRTFGNCLLLHRLLVIGEEEEVLSRRHELSSDLLSHYCELEYKGNSLKKVR